MKNATAGPDWFDLPAPRPHELPELYKQVEALRLRRAMDPKVHAKADPGEKKGIKGLPKFFAVRVSSSPSTLLVHGSLISRYFFSYYLPFLFLSTLFSDVSTHSWAVHSYWSNSSPVCTWLLHVATSPPNFWALLFVRVALLSSYL